MRWLAGLVALLATSTAWHIWPHKAAYRRIVAVGDLHGDYEHALSILRAAGVIHEHSTAWSGGATVLVSTGDSVDRGDDALEIYQLFESLRSESAAHGGQVVTLLGNHEMMNAMKDWRYVSEGDFKRFGGADARAEAMSTRGWLGQAWIQHYAATARISLLDDAARGVPKPYASFVHGGITASLGKLGVDAINAHSHALLARALNSTERDGYVPPDATQPERTMWTADGPFWYRGHATDPEPAACVHANQTRQALDVQTLIMGHTPSMGGIDARCDGQLLVIDTGISRAYGGRLSALVIESWVASGVLTRCVHTRYDALYVPGEQTTIRTLVECT